MSSEDDRGAPDVGQPSLASRATAELLAGLFARLPYVLGLNLVVALTTVVVLARYAAPTALGAWLLVMLASLGLRLKAWRDHLAARRPPEAVAYWARRFTLGAAGTGAVWGLAAVLFYQSEALVAQAYLSFLLAGMVGGSVTALTGYMPAFAAFSTCALVPYAVRLAATGDLPHLAMAALVVLYLIGIGFLGRTVSASLVEAVRLAVENQDLAAALRTKSQELEATFNHVNQGVAMFDPDGRLTTWNPRHRELHGYPGALYRRGTPVTAFQRHDRARAAEDQEPDPRATEVTLAPVRYEQSGADGRVLEVERRPMPDGGFVATSTDITERKRAEVRMRHLAQHDALTGLPNRLLFHDRLEQAMVRCRREGRHLAVMLLDLDKFKDINDALGHGTGDRALQEVARRLRVGLRESDTVARIGGDEFALLFPALTEPDAAALIAAKILSRLAQPLAFDSRSFELRASLGITLFPRDGDDAEALVHHADLAMYRAKAKGGGFHAFGGPVERAARRDQSLEVELARALAAGELHLEYQPLFDLAAARVSGAEALLRWHHADRGQIAPESLIEVAEASGQIDQVTELALVEACRTAAAWAEDGGAPLRIAVNISTTQLGRDDLLDVVRRALQRSGLSAERLELELTESNVLGDDDGVLRTLERLHDLGVCLALDDFGTGYASLSHLKRLPFDALKIDRTFIADLTAEPEAAIVRSLIELGHRLGLRVIAEGVETEAELAALRRLGCDEVQGHIIGRPKSAGAMAAWLRDRGDAVV